MAGKGRPVTIVGVGLIGGSIGLALRAAGWEKVGGLEVNSRHLEEALQLGAVSFGDTALTPELANAEIFVLATPVPQIVPAAHLVAKHARPGAVITDTGSTKEEIVRSLAGTLPADIWFVGGHPLAGSEETGIKGADPYLLENAFYLLTPLPSTPPAAVEAVVELVEATGAIPCFMSPQEHDRLVATVSHLPHLVAVALVQTAERLVGEGDLQRFAAGGFRDTTRVASGSPALWRGIISSNRAHVLAALDSFLAVLGALREAVEAGDFSVLEEQLARARAIREAIPRRGKGMLAPAWELVVQVADRPGAISTVTSILAQAGINIRDIEILRVREGEGGSLRLAVENQEMLTRALTLLSKAGYTVRARQ